MPRLILIGRGSTAERLAELAARLGYSEIRLIDAVPDDLAEDDHLVVAEDEPDAGRRHLMRAAKGTLMPAYLGYAAPHPEGWKALVALAAAGVPKARLDAISAPAGVDVGAESPDEVAIAVAAELVAILRGRPRPSAGLAVSAPRTPASEPRPRRLLGALGRSPKREPGDGEGRN